MERIDRAFANMLWLEQFTNHRLKSLSSDCSDLAPLLLQLNTEPWATPRFRFEAFWVKLDGFDDIVRQAWDCDLTGVDACRARLISNSDALPRLLRVGACAMLAAFAYSSSWRERSLDSSTSPRKLEHCPTMKCRCGMSSKGTVLALRRWRAPSRATAPGFVT